jgi:hypothetical protein
LRELPFSKLLENVLYTCDLFIVANATQGLLIDLQVLLVSFFRDRNSFAGMLNRHLFPVLDRYITSSTLQRSKSVLPQICPP